MLLVFLHLGVNIDANGNIVGDDSTNISGINSVTATTFVGNLTGNADTATTAGTVTTAAQPNITSLGTLTSLNVDGDVGIGTNSPDSKLHLEGQGNENITLKLEPGTTAGNYSELVIGRTDGSGNIRTTPAVKAGIPISGVPGILLGSENTNVPAVAIQTPNTDNGHIVFNPKGSERLRHHVRWVDWYSHNDRN